ncbi:MAG: secondary thiamine-phosphate synthase enzyme YjbQ [Gammaproteobacteria bacterium]|nr:secondary thiamine-phosphate synthase enzyme YjbQ [Gammaproteobacteria bacterium]
MIYQDTLQLTDHGKGAYEITALVEGFIRESNIRLGTCQLFIHSSSASLLIGDIADDTTKNQTAAFMAQLAPSSDNAEHRINASMNAIPENMRYALAQTSLSIPVSNGKPGIGVWQGIFLWEQSVHAAERKLTITVSGE